MFGYERHLPERASGLFRADVGRLHSFTASAHLWLNQPDQAAHHARQASAIYRAAPALAPSRYSIAELDRAIALTRLGDPDRSAHHGIAALTATRHAAAVLTRAADLNATLTNRYPASVAARAFTDAFRAYAISVPVPAARTGR